MPSPFPGMDPYLERPEIFPDFHDRFITHLSEFLQVDLPPAYYAGIGRRTWIDFAERSIGPDVELLQRHAERNHPSGRSAVLEHEVDKPIAVYIPSDEIAEPLVEIYTRQGTERRLVTSIELLSPKNKERGAYGRDLYVKKQQEIVKHSQVHLVEIDLLRSGEHTTALSLQALRKALGACDYHVCVHCFDKPDYYFVNPIQLESPLPAIEVPLLPGDGEVKVDLQAVFNRTYDAGPYRREIDYARDTPEPPLDHERAEWAKGLVADYLKRPR